MKEPIIVAEVSIESDYWSRGHFYQGGRKILRPLIDLSQFPVGTKLVVIPPTDTTPVELKPPGYKPGAGSDLNW